MGGRPARRCLKGCDLCCHMVCELVPLKALVHDCGSVLGFGAACVLTETWPQLAGQDDVVVNLGEMSIAGLLLGFRRVASCAGLGCVMCCSVVCEFAC